MLNFLYLFFFGNFNSINIYNSLFSFYFHIILTLPDLFKSLALCILTGKFSYFTFFFKEIYKSKTEISQISISYNEYPTDLGCQLNFSIDPQIIKVLLDRDISFL